MSLDHATEIVKQQTVTRDAFLGGRLTLLQPARGFRAGLDSVLLGAAVAINSGRLLDLGAGVGAAALTALAHHPQLFATLAEIDPQICALATENIAANRLAGRADAGALDVTSKASGLRDQSFAAVIANPPFFDVDKGTAASTRNSGARQMPAGQLERWVLAAVSAAAPRDSEIIFILPAASLSAILAAFAGRQIALTILPLTPRETEPANRILVRGRKGSKAPLTLLASRALHAPQGQAFRPEFEAIFRGEERLHW